MVNRNTLYHLGRRTYSFFILKRMTVSIVLLLVALVIVAFGSSFVQLGISMSSLSGPVTQSVVFGITTFVSNTVFTLLFVAFIFGAVGFIIGSFEYRNYTIRFEDFNIGIKRGIINLSEISTPYHQIQDVSLERDITHRTLGLSRLILNTIPEGAGGTSQISIDFIDEDLAKEFLRFLDSIIGVQIIQSTNPISFAAQTQQNPVPPVQPTPTPPPAAK